MKVYYFATWVIGIAGLAVVNQELFGNNQPLLVSCVTFSFSWVLTTILLRLYRIDCSK